MMSTNIHHFVSLFIIIFVSVCIPVFRSVFSPFRPSASFYLLYIFLYLPSFCKSTVHLALFPFLFILNSNSPVSSISESMFFFSTSACFLLSLPPSSLFSHTFRSPVSLLNSFPRCTRGGDATEPRIIQSTWSTRARNRQTPGWVCQDMHHFPCTWYYEQQRRRRQEWE